MLIEMAKLEADISIFHEARKKYDKCPHAVQNTGHQQCNLFHYALNTSFDILHHCSSCKVNTKEPTTSGEIVRNP